MATITYDKFVKNHLGKGVDYDSVAGVQCVDLAKAYLDEVFGIKPGAWGDAYCYYDNFNNHKELVANFTRIANTSSLVPKKGDICVWKSTLSSAGHGHIAIATGEGDTTYFYSYDQNWTGKHDPCTKIKHNYNQFAGVLRPKDQTKITGVKTTETKSLDTTGFKKGDKSVGVLALKRLLLIAKAKKLISVTVDDTTSFGSGTEKAVNALLSKWGYKETGIAGEKFINKLYEKIK
jgi:hypothetical protein